MIRGKAPDEIRKTFNISDDLSSEGSDANEWLEENCSRILDSNPFEPSPQSDPMNQ